MPFKSCLRVFRRVTPSRPRLEAGAGAGSTKRGSPDAGSVVDYQPRCKYLSDVYATMPPARGSSAPAARAPPHMRGRRHVARRRRMPRSPRERQPRNIDDAQTDEDWSAQFLFFFFTLPPSSLYRYPKPAVRSVNVSSQIWRPVDRVRYALNCAGPGA